MLIPQNTINTVAIHFVFKKLRKMKYGTECIQITMSFLSWGYLSESKRRENIITTLDMYARWLWV